MRRGAKITLPYTLCLFAAVLFVVLLVGLTVGALAYRDTARVRPEQAHGVLSEALDDVNQRLASHFEAAMDHVRLGQRWIAQGALDIHSMDRWSALLLPPLVNRDEIRAVEIFSEKGTVWRAVRQNEGWAGHWSDRNSARAATAAHWDALGRSLKRGMPLPPEDGARFAAALEAFSSENDIETDALYVEEYHRSDGESFVTLAMSIGSMLGSRGIIAIEVCDPAEAYGNSDIPSGVVVQSDPGGQRLGALDQSQIRALLTTQAVPQLSNLALRTLFPAPDGASASRWYAARPYHLGNYFTWWSVASVSQDALPAPVLPVRKYALAGLLAGLIGSGLVAFALGWKISTPLAHIARRANNIQAIDEHYIPWPESRFTELNKLTNALEDLYESAVEHLDYQEAPLIVWAQEETLSGSDGIIDAEPVKRHINLRGQTDEAEPPEEPAPGPVINVRSESPQDLVVPAAQLQVLHGSRKEVRRLQGQLAGAYEELRTSDTHYQQSETRLKRQRRAIRSLDKQLQRDKTVSIAALSILRDALDVCSVSLWRPERGEGVAFGLRLSTDSNPDITPIPAGIMLRSLLQEELVVSTRDLHGDPRLADLKSCPKWAGRRCALLLAPLKFRGKLLGFLLVERDQAGSTWKADEEAFLANCAIQYTMVLGYKHRNESLRRTMSDAPVNGNGNARRTGAGEEGVLHWETDLAGCIKSVRGDWADIYGYAPEALLGQPLTFLSSREEGERDLAQLRHVLSGTPCVGHETRHVTADGSVIALTVRAEVQRDTTGRVVGVRGTAVLSTVPTG